MNTTRLLLIFLTLSLICNSVLAQDPNWGTLVSLDKAELVVEGTMRVENNNAGIGHLQIEKVLKGEVKSDFIKIHFADKKLVIPHTKQAEPPRYVYTDGQKGIWILHSKNNDQRYNLNQSNVYFEEKWMDWMRDKIRDLNLRKWTVSVNGLSGSVIVDDVGPNKSYRFFILCVRNDSTHPFYINTHFRIKEKEQQRFQAYIITPDKSKIDLLTGNDIHARMDGEPGWPSPDPRDMVLLQPGQKMYLPYYGRFYSFYKQPVPGQYLFHAIYLNQLKRLNKFDGKIWTGQLIFPETTFQY